MDPSTLKAFSDQTDLAATEVLTQQSNLFNAATRGAIVLRAANNRGDYANFSKYGLISGLVAERNQYGTGAVSALSPSRILEGSVKVARRVGPVTLDQGIWDWIGRPADSKGVTGGEAAGTWLGQQISAAMMADYLNTAIAAYVAAILNVGSTLVNDTSAALALTALADGATKLGDRANQIVCWVMHSKSWNDLYKSAISGTNVLFTYGTVNIVADPLGRPFIITDSADLKNGSDYYTLGLTAGGLVLDVNGPVDGSVVYTHLTENVGKTYQGEYTFNLGMKGFQWASGTGGASPSDAALATGTNWTKTATDVKDCAGVIVTAH